MSVNKERVQLWVDALNSGTFLQGRSQLRTIIEDKEYFCCLGVACEVYKKETGDGEWESDQPKEKYRFSAKNSSSYVFLPAAIADWFGSYSSNPQFPVGRAPGCIEANDLYNLSFQEIAKLIAQYYLTDV